MIKHRHLPHVCSFRDNPIVFFTACTHKRRKLLACAQVHAILRSVWERSAERADWWVGHYILMPDHVHFFARHASIARPMADWIKMWKSVSSRQLAAALDIAPPIWQPEYFDRYLRSQENYGQKWNYVEQNALRAGLIKESEEWQYRGSIFDLMW